MTKSESVVTEIQVGQIIPNRDQPRKSFPDAHINSLAASIKDRGLLQPISVRQIAADQFEIIAGECRWRAHIRAGLTTIRCIVYQEMDELDRDILAIVENLQRQDVNLIDEARAFQRMLDRGMEIEALATRVGKPVRSIKDRVQLLSMQPRFQELAVSGQLTPYQSWYLSLLSTDRQDRLFRAIQAGKCETLTKLKALAEALLAEQNQPAMFSDDECGKVSEVEAEAISAMERKIEAIAAMAAAGFNGANGVDVAKKIAPHKAREMADKLDMIQQAIAHLTKDLRRTAAQMELAAA